MTKTEAIENLKWLRECSYVDEFEAEDNEALDMAIKALEQEPSGDLISRQAVLDLLEDTNNGWIINEVSQLPPVIPQEPTEGHWIEKDGFDGDVYYDCSECGESFCLIEGTPTDNLYNYCPNCGAKMSESEETETWNGIHAQITVPKGTFDKIWEDAESEDER